MVKAWVVWVVAAIAACAAASVEAADAIWATPATTPQRRDDPPPPRNALYDGKQALLAAARNEAEALVVRVRGAGGPLTVSDLKGPQGAVIPASAVRVFELIQGVDHCLDAMVPRDALVLGDNGAALLRIHVPPDAPDGLYQGQVKVGALMLPVKLTVWPHALPSVPTFHRVAPYWSSHSPNREAGLAGAKAELDALWRARITPVHGFWGKRPWWMFLKSMDVDPSADWPDVDAFYRHYFALGGRLIDIDWYYANAHGINLKDKGGNRANAIRYLRTCWDHFERKLAAAEHIFVQNRADEPNLGQGKDGRQHCEYARAIAWSKVIREAAPKLRILIAEHPAPQLHPWTDIFNTTWCHARGPDARELETMGKRLMWYSPDIKTPGELPLARTAYWRAFARSLHGAWTWERYRYLRAGKEYRFGCIYRPGTLGGTTTATAVGSMKLEAAGEGHDDFEALRLLDRWAGDRFVALSFAQHSLKRTGPASPPSATDLQPPDFARLRRTLAFLLDRKHVATTTFRSLDHLARLQNIDLVTGDTGFARLAPARTAPCNTLTPFGAAKATAEPGGIRLELTGGTDMAGIDFAGERVSPAREVRLDIRVQPNPEPHDGLANMGLFDIFLRVDGRYGTGVSWKTGEYNRTLGHWSDSGSFPGAWRSIRCVLAHTIDAPAEASSVGIAIGRTGYYDTNDPLPGQRYVLHVRNARITSMAHERRGVIESEPIAVPDGPAWLWWVSEPHPLPGTGLKLEARRGSGPFAPVSPVPGLLGVAALPEGSGPVTLRVTLTGGAESPYVHAIGILAPREKESTR